MIIWPYSPHEIFLASSLMRRTVGLGRRGGLLVVLEKCVGGGVGRCRTAASLVPPEQELRLVHTPSPRCRSSASQGWGTHCHWSDGKRRTDILHLGTYQWQVGKFHHVSSPTADESKSGPTVTYTLRERQLRHIVGALEATFGSASCFFGSRSL